MKFNERLLQLRKDSKLSRARLSELTGISASSINMYERGEREPGFDTLETFADFFNVDMDYLLGKSDIPNFIKYVADKSPSKDSTDAQDQEFLSLFRSLSPVARELVIKQMEGIVGHKD